MSGTAELHPDCSRLTGGGRGHPPRFVRHRGDEVVEVERETTMKTAMNATAIVKIVRGRKRCRSAVVADSASESPHEGAQITEQIGSAQHLVPLRRQQPASMTAHAMMEPSPIAASTGLKRTLGDPLPGWPGPASGQCRWTGCSAVATRPNPSRATTRREDASTARREGAVRNAPRVRARSCSHARSNTRPRPVAEPPSAASLGAGGRAP